MQHNGLDVRFYGCFYKVTPFVQLYAFCKIHLGECYKNVVVVFNVCFCKQFGGSGLIVKICLLS